MHQSRTTLLPEGPAPQKNGWLKWLVALGGIFTLGIAGVVLWREYDASTNPSVRALGPVRVDSVGAAEHLDDVLHRHRIDTAGFFAALRLIGTSPDSILPGTLINLREQTKSPKIVAVSFRQNADRRVDVRLIRKNWQGFAETIAWIGDPTVIAGTFGLDLEPMIDSTEAAGLTMPVQLAFLTELRDALWQIEFARRIVPLDRFRVVARLERSSDGQRRLRDVRAIELVLGSTPSFAYRFEPTDGPPGYFDEQGRALRRPFLRVPLASYRTTSEYTNYRFHPILRVGRAHRGVDYGAPEGSVVLAAAPGTVRIAGDAGDLGNLVEIDHGNGVSTRYAHLSKIGPGIRPGALVVMGQPIAAVGQTGLSTAPHLHYEFRIRGEPVDMRWLEVDVGQPIADRLAGAFANERNRLRTLLDQAEPAPAR